MSKRWWESAGAGGLVEGFVREAAQGSGGTEARMSLFYAVRNLPYATDGASDARSLLLSGRGNCLAKADLLARGFRLLGHRARRVRFLYRLPDHPLEVELLPSREDIHAATEVEVGGRWVFVDATHDSPLARGGLTVGEWNGVHPTPPAYRPHGPLWREGEDDAEIAEAITAVIGHYLGTPEGFAASEVGSSYRQAFNDWLRSLRTIRPR